MHYSLTYNPTNNIQYYQETHHMLKYLFSRKNKQHNNVITPSNPNAPTTPPEQYRCEYYRHKDINQKDIVILPIQYIAESIIHAIPHCQNTNAHYNFFMITPLTKEEIRDNVKQFVGDDTLRRILEQKDIPDTPLPFPMYLHIEYQEHNEFLKGYDTYTHSLGLYHALVYLMTHAEKITCIQLIPDNRSNHPMRFYRTPLMESARKYAQTNQLINHNESITP